MGNWHLVLQGIELALTWQNLLLLIVGFFLGVIVGILPGIGPAAGMALILPFSYNLPATSALILMSGIYLASNYGGSIAAILVNTPGESASASTLLDGYPMTQNGRAAEALGISATAGSLGGMLGLVVLIFTAPLLARLALLFGPPENAMLAFFALSVISAIVKRNPIKGLISACIGLVLATVGMDLVSGNYRFTFGLDDLQDGVPFIQTMVGLFAVAQVIILAEFNRGISRVELAGSGLFTGVKTTFRHPFTLLRAFIIGLWIGALPAAGRNTASFMAYAEEVRAAKDKSQFGKGNPVGVIASEMANNSCAMGDLIPTLSLGIPGSVSAAVFLGIMMIFGITPGYKVFIDHGKEVYGLFTAFFIENLLILILGLTYAKYLAKITVVRNDIIVPMILVFSMLGSYSIRNSVFDLFLTSLFGIMGYFMARYGYSPVPLVLALVLGPMLEKNFQRAMIISDGSYRIFVQSKISIVLVIMTVFSLFYPYLSVLFTTIKKRGSSGQLLKE